MDSHFFSSLTKFKLEAGKSRRDDDFADRINHSFSTLLLVIFSLVVSARQYIGKPIACWVPTEFTRAQEEYAESACWVSNTYFVQPVSSVPDDVDERENLKIHYYQWVPFMLMIQAFFFNVPYILWRLFNWQSGMNLPTIMEVAGDIELLKDFESRKANILYVAYHIEDSLSVKRDHVKQPQNCFLKCLSILSKCFLTCFGQRKGNYLISLYLLSKFMYIVNIFLQFICMTWFLDRQYTFFGFSLLKNLIEGRDWDVSGNFPRVTMCDFVIRKLANKHRHTIQCVLPLNMFNEKIYIFLWFWCVFIFTLSAMSFSEWWLKNVRVARIEFIMKFLRLRGLLGMGEKQKVLAFVDNFLRADGVFMIRLIAINVGEVVASEICERLWLIYTDHPLAHKTTSMSHIQLPQQQQQHNNTYTRGSLSEARAKPKRHHFSKKSEAFPLSKIKEPPSYQIVSTTSNPNNNKRFNHSITNSFSSDSTKHRSRSDETSKNSDRLANLDEDPGEVV